MGWEGCVCRWGWGGRCSQAQRWGVHAPLNPSPFCPHHGLLEFHNFNSLAVFFVEKRSTCSMFALFWECPHVPRDPAALGGHVSPPWAWCWCLSTEFPALRSQMAVLGAWQWERGGAHPLRSMSCALGGDALTPEAGGGGVWCHPRGQPASAGVCRAGRCLWC